MCVSQHYCRLRRSLHAALLFGSCMLAVPAALAQNVERDLADIESRANQLQAQQLRKEQLRSPTHVEERLADGELFYQLKDYTRAAIILSDIVNNYPNHTAYPNAVYMFAESLYKARDFFGARSYFRKVLENSTTPGYRSYVKPSIERLVDIAIHTQDFREIDNYFARLNQLPPSDITVAANYQRAKILFNRAIPVAKIIQEDPGANPQMRREEDSLEKTRATFNLAQLDEARRLFAAVPKESPFWSRAMYFVGTIHALNGKFPEAIEVFSRIVKAPAADATTIEVAELAQLALGRLYYETDQIDKAIVAYQTVPRTSKHFERALFEIAWAHIRIGDAIRAERALEVLNVVNPDSVFIADGQLLRANLLLRGGRHEPAEDLFRDVRNRFGPVLRQLDETLNGVEDPIAYFRGIVRQNIETFDAETFLPETARRHSRLSGGDMERATRAISDIYDSRKLVAETEDIAGKLDVILNSPNRVHAHADLRQQLQVSTTLRNRLALLRGRTLDKNRAVGAAVEIRSRRQRLEPELRRLPMQLDDFKKRDDKSLNAQRRLEREIKNLEIEVQGMQARVVAARQFLKQSEKQGSDLGASKSTLEEIANHERAIDDYKKQLALAQRQLGFARLQVGIGDATYARDRELVREYIELTEEERSALAQTGGASSALASTFARISRVEAELDTRESEVMAVVDERSGDMRTVLDEEKANLVRYRQELGELESEAEEVVGVIAYQNFKLVQRRFYNLILRADVGRIDVAWARREEHRMRVDALTRERSEELQAIDDEFQEVMDLGGSSGTEASP